MASEIEPTQKAPEPPSPSYVDICENMDDSDEVDGRTGRYIWSLEVWSMLVHLVSVRLE